MATSNLIVIDVDAVNKAIVQGFLIGLTAWGVGYGLNKIFGVFRMLLK